MARINAPADWQPLPTRDDWAAHNRGGVLVVHQRKPLRDEHPTKYHGRNCRPVPHRVFLDGPAAGGQNSEWFRAPDPASARAGGAVACELCDGQD
jgi:hypothetical protein